MLPESRQITKIYNIENTSDATIASGYIKWKKTDLKIEINRFDLRKIINDTF